MPNASRLLLGLSRDREGDELYTRLGIRRRYYKVGIAFSHCAASWGYEGFNAFRTKLAREIGISLAGMDGYGGHTMWEDLPNADDPIIPLLTHIDSGGVLTWQECAVIAPRLRELMGNWLADDDMHKSRGLQLADGMDKVVLTDSELVFC